MVYKNLCVLVLWTKVTLALEGLITSLYSILQRTVLCPIPSSLRKPTMYYVKVNMTYDIREHQSPERHLRLYGETKLVKYLPYLSQGMNEAIQFSLQIIFVQ